MKLLRELLELHLSSHLRKMAAFRTKEKGQGEYKIWVSSRKVAGFQHHYPRVKVSAPSNRTGTVIIGMSTDKKVRGNLSDEDIRIVLNFCKTYDELIQAVWNEDITNDQAIEVYDLSKTRGISAIPNLIKEVKSRA
jgi:hypothetical protein